ncbi:MAG: flippase [Lachnospiraceae bacterium]|nr:flippase [Lachnospiraceae bacterium]
MEKENSAGSTGNTGRDKRKGASGEKSIGVNAILNFIKVGCSIVFPLITFPYTSRVLQVESIGKVNYANSIITYFALFAALGITTYGVREGVRKKRGAQFERFASEIFTLNLLTTAVSYAVLFIMLLLVPKFRDYRAVILIQSLTIFLTTLGVEWVNTVYEDYFYIAVRSIVIQILSIAALFLFIHRPEDYLKYACISVMSSGLMCVANWIYCRRYVHIRILSDPAVFRHLYPMFIFFANNLAITIYVSADTTMLGWIAGDYYTGLYAVSVKIYQIIKRLMTAVYTVTIPRLSRFAGNGDWQNYRKLLTRICCVLILLLVPSMTGLAVYAKNIIFIISGERYLPAVRSLQILAIALLFAVGSGVVVNCINTPNGFEKTSLSATIVAAVVNVGLNIFLIPVLRQDGAAVTTVIAEAMVMIICLVRLRDLDHYVDVHEVLVQAAFAAAGAALILGISAGVGRTGLSPLHSLLLGLVLCPAAYAVLLAAGRNTYFLSAAQKLLRSGSTPNRFR